MGPTIHTSSRLRMWYLRLVRQCPLHHRVLKPVVMVRGIVLYSNEWVLGGN